MEKLRYMSFEINNECPLTEKHPKCPRNIADRYALSRSKDPIAVDDIAGFFRYCAERRGFGGLVNMHDYNEPLETPERIMEIMDRIPEARISVWTNGVLLKNEEPYIEIVERCAEMMVTVYPETNIEAVRELRRRYPHIRTQHGRLDNRMVEHVIPGNGQNFAGCNRVNFDIVIGYYGDVHMCCSDWRGEIVVGNIKTDPYSDILQVWQLYRESLVKRPAPGGFGMLPRICQVCFTREPHISSPTL